MKRYNIKIELTTSLENLCQQIEVCQQMRGNEAEEIFLSSMLARLNIVYDCGWSLGRQLSFNVSYSNFFS